MESRPAGMAEETKNAVQSTEAMAPLVAIGMLAGGLVLMVFAMLHSLGIGDALGYGFFFVHAAARSVGLHTLFIAVPFAVLLSLVSFGLLRANNPAGVLGVALVVVILGVALFVGRRERGDSDYPYHEGRFNSYDVSFGSEGEHPHRHGRGGR